MTQPEVKSFMNKELRKYGYKPVLADGFLFAEGEIKIGLVAHMDTVHSVPKFVYYENGEMTTTTGLGADDRAGIYGILHLVKQGFRPTIILLEDEEKGCIGAGKFVKANIEIDVNYLIELDRQGSNDAVFYDCDNPEFTSYVCRFGFAEAIGSYSDISDIAPHYGIAAVNLSVGYYLQHTVREYMVIGEFARTLRIVAKMLRVPSEMKFNFVQKDYKYKSTRYKYLTDGDDYEWERDWYYGKKYDTKKKTASKVSKGELTEIMINGRTLYWNGEFYENEYGEYVSEDTLMMYAGDYLPISRGILLLDDGDMIDVELCKDLYYIGIDDKIYNSYTISIDARLVDDNYMPLTYADVFEMRC